MTTLIQRESKRDGCLTTRDVEPGMVIIWHHVSGAVSSWFVVARGTPKKNNDPAVWDQDVLWTKITWFVVFSGTAKLVHELHADGSIVFIGSSAQTLEVPA